MRKVIVHIDLNAFFVRAEEIRDPSLINKPVAIGHLGRGGVVSTCSYKAREFGVKSGMPMYQAKNLCPQLIIKPGDYRYYEGLSNEFMKFVRNITPLMEIASVDECFADFTDIVKGKRDVEGFFRDIQKRLYEQTKLKCSIGVGPTKFLAKMASDYRKPLGLTIIRKKDIPDILYPLPIGDFFGIGKKSQPKLIKAGIITIGDLAKRIEGNDPETKRLLGKFYDTCKAWLSGEGDDTINLSERDPKSIGHSTTLSEDTNSLDIIKNKLMELSKRVSNQLISERKLTNTISVVAKESDFKVHNKSTMLSSPTSDWKVIYQTSCKLYERNFLDLTVRLVGVTAQKLINIEDMAVQMSFFDYEQHEQENRTKLLINAFNRKLSKPVIKRASEVKKEKKDEHK